MTHIEEQKINTYIKYVIYMFMYAGMFLIPLFCYMALIQKNKLPYVTFKIKKKIRASEIVFTLGVIAFGGSLSDLLFWGLENIGVLVPKYITELPTDALGLLSCFIYLVVIPAVCEELLFRGAVLDAFLNAPDGSDHINAIIVSAAFFSAMHCDFRKFMYTFLAGLAIGHIVYKSGTVLYGMVIHAVNNAISFAFLLFDKYFPDFKAVDIIYNVFIICATTFFIIRKTCLCEQKRIEIERFIENISIPAIFYILFTFFIATRRCL